MINYLRLNDKNANLEFEEVPMFCHQRTEFGKGHDLRLHHQKILIKFDKFFKNV